MIYKTIKFDNLEWWYRISGNRYGWTLFVQRPSTPQAPVRNGIKYPVWEQPENKVERKKYYEDLVKECIENYGDKI